jgi:hypothetical protein
MALNVARLDGCVLVSGEPRLLQSGLNAKRGKATVQLFGLGVHSVIDHLGELDTCLADISLRRLKGEKP